MSDFLSSAQIMGYAAFALGVAAFLQKCDTRLKILSAAQCLVYALHFALLGNYAAATSAFVASVRTVLALRYSSHLLAATIVVVTLVLGVLAAGPWWGWLTVASACLTTVAMFTLRGVALRLAMLVGTAFWLVNNVLSGSIGGALLECFIGVANLATIARMRKNARTAGTQDQRLKTWEEEPLA